MPADWSKQAFDSVNPLSLRTTHTCPYELHAPIYYQHIRGECLLYELESWGVNY